MLQMFLLTTRYKVQQNLSERVFKLLFIGDSAAVGMLALAERRRRTPFRVCGGSVVSGGVDPCQREGLSCVTAVEFSSTQGAPWKAHRDK